MLKLPHTSFSKNIATFTFLIRRDAFDSVLQCFQDGLSDASGGSGVLTSDKLAVDKDFGLFKQCVCAISPVLHSLADLEEGTYTPCLLGLGVFTTKRDELVFQEPRYILVSIGQS